MSRRRSLSDDERVLWRTVTQSIAPLRGRKAEPEAEKPALARSPDEAKRNPGRPLPHSDSLHAGHTPQPAPRPPSLAPIDRRMKQKLARGKTEFGGRIDLHGMTQAEAHDALQRFLRRAQAEGAKFVLVITGKGGPGGDRGVLRRQVPLWLALPELRPCVLGFDIAHVGHGGEGALYVRLRKGR